MAPRLFAVYLGGRAPRASIELHDMVFVAGETIEDCHEQILDKWFGTPGHVHIDSFLELDIVDGWKIELHAPSALRIASAATGTSSAGASRAGENRPRLFFVNLGAYNGSDFTELHAVSFHVRTEAPQAKAAAMARHFTQGVTQPHKDDLIDVDDCMAIDAVNGWHIALTRTNAVSANRPSNAYHAIPKAVVAAWMARKS